MKKKENPFAIDKRASEIYYLKEACPGITRKKTRDSFIYYNPDGEKIKDPDILIRIKSLVLPPAWQNVWISPFANSHLQATGIDARGRKQYRYHPDWNKKRSETKFAKLINFAKALPELRTQIESELRHPAITKEKVIAIVVDLMSKSFMRVGNTGYVKQNGSFGLTTLLDKHVKINGDTLKFYFKGKKGVWQDIELHDKKLAHLVKSCRDIPGHELFQYYDDEGHRHVIDSGDVNAFLHQICGERYSAKDFRTWAGTFHAFKSFANLPVPQSETEFKHSTVEVLKEVSKVLGNTPTVCRKYYVHPVLLKTYSNGELFKFLSEKVSNRQKTFDNITEDIFVEFLSKVLSE